MGGWWIVVSICTATGAMGAPATAPTTQALERQFPWVIFDEDFSGYPDTAHPPTWEVVRHSIHSHRHGWVHDGTYAVLNSGNWHCPRVPPQKDFVLELKARADPSTDVALVLVYFRLNVRARTGYTLFYRWGKRFGVRCTLHAVPGWNTLPRSTRAHSPKPDVAHWARLRLVVIGQHIRFYHDDTLQGEWHETTNRHTAAGRIALDIVGCNPPVPGPKYLDDVRIRARRPRKRTLVWKQDRVRVPIRTPSGDPGALVFRLEWAVVDPVDVLAGCVRLTAPFGKTAPWQDIRIQPRVDVLDRVGRVVGSARMTVGPLKGRLVSTPCAPGRAVVGRPLSRPLIRISPGLAGDRDLIGQGANPDHVCDMRVGRWIALPGVLRDGVALGIDVPDVPGARNGAQLALAAGRAHVVRLRAAGFAEPGPGTVCVWRLVRADTGTDSDAAPACAGTAKPIAWAARDAEPIRSLGMHSVAFRVQLGVVPPGTYRLELTTWMGGRTRRRDDVPVVVGGP